MEGYETKRIEYAYPTSPAAEQYGYGRNGQKGAHNMNTEEMLQMRPDEILLTHTPHGWMAEYIGSERATIIDLFNSAVLPTGFTGHAPYTTVHAEIQRRNPGYTVRRQP